MCLGLSTVLILTFCVLSSCLKIIIFFKIWLSHLLLIFSGPQKCVFYCTQRHCWLCRQYYRLMIADKMSPPWAQVNFEPTGTCGDLLSLVFGTPTFGKTYPYAINIHWSRLSTGYATWPRKRFRRSPKTTNINTCIINVRNDAAAVLRTLYDQRLADNVPVAHDKLATILCRRHVV